MQGKRPEYVFLLIVLALVSVLSFFVFRHFLSTLVLATVFAITFSPLYEILRKRLKSRGLASILTIVLILIFILGPLSIIGIQIFHESRDLYFSISSGGKDGIVDFVNQAIVNLGKSLPIPEVTVDLDQYVSKGLGALLSNIGAIFQNFAGFLAGLIIFFIALYYFFKDSESIKDSIKSLSPLGDDYDTKIIKRISSSIETLVRGTLLIAIIKGIVASFGFLIFGVANPVLWGFVTALTALIPGIGTGLVFVPAVLFLFLVGSMPSAVGLLFWGIGIVGLLDNFLGPRLMTKGTKLHPLLVLLSVIGGLSFFGPVGFLLGPVIVSLFFTLVDILTHINQENKIG